MNFHKILSKLTALEGPSVKRTIRESVEIKADGIEAMTLLGHPNVALPQPADDFGMADEFDAPMADEFDAPMAAPDDMSMDELQRLSGIDPVEEEVDTLYANTPDEDIKPLSAAFPSGNDLHREKKSYRASALGDNPSAVATLEEKLMKSLQEYLRESESDDEDDKRNSLRPGIDHDVTYGKDKNKVGKPAKGVDDNKLRATKG